MDASFIFILLTFGKNPSTVFGTEQADNFPLRHHRCNRILQKGKIALWNFTPSESENYEIGLEKIYNPVSVYILCRFM